MKSYSPIDQQLWQSVFLRSLVFLAMIASACSSSQTLQDQPPALPASQQTHTQDVSHFLPMGFVANEGQLDPSVVFQGLGYGGGLFFTASEVIWSLSQAQASSMVPDPVLSGSTDEISDQQTSNIRIQFLGTNPSVRISARDHLPGKVSFFLGNDPARWRSLLTAYRTLTYHQIYPGVDLRFEKGDEGLKGTYTLSPRADPSIIHWRYSDEVTVNIDKATGSLAVKARDGTLLLNERTPLAWQEMAGKRLPVSARYVLAADGSLGFEIGTYEPSLPVTIDPIIVFSTYLGGSDNDESWDVAVDQEGNAYVVGYTSSSDFPNTSTLPRGTQRDVFVTKLSADGQAILYSAVFGGSEWDQATGIALDSEGKAYITGDTYSTNFPLQQALQDQLKGRQDAFISVLDLTEGILRFSTYLGGSSSDNGNNIQVTPSGKIVVGGTTQSPDFPVIQGALDTSLGGVIDGFIAMIDTTDFSLDFNTFFGGSGFDPIIDVVIGEDDSIFLAGHTTSLDLPIVNPLQGSPGGGNCFYGTCYDTFVARLASDGSDLLYSTYLGGSRTDTLTDMTLDNQGNIYLLGRTDSLNFPLQNPIQPAMAGGSMFGDFFITKISKSGDSLSYSTYLGGQSDEQSSGIAVDDEGRAYITGDTASYCIPILSRVRSTGSQDALLVALSPDGQNVVSYSYFRGNGYNHGEAMDFDSDENLFLVGVTSSTDFPTVNALDDTLSGSEDGFLMKLANSPRPPMQSHILYLPSVHRSEPIRGIHGYVNYQGCGAAGIPLELRFYNGSSWSTLATTTSASNGLFTFPNMPSLAPGQKYYVRFINPAENDSYLSYWETRELNTYISGSDVLIGDFNLENIYLSQPPDTAIVTLPYTFEWYSRYMISTDSFDFNLFDYDNPALFWWTNPLGYTTNYTLNSLPSGFHHGIYYLWYIGAYGPDGGYGMSYYARWVCISTGCPASGQAIPMTSLSASRLKWPEVLSPNEGYKR